MLFSKFKNEGSTTTVMGLQPFLFFKQPQLNYSGFMSTLLDSVLSSLNFALFILFFLLVLLDFILSSLYFAFALLDFARSYQESALSFVNSILATICCFISRNR